jgi:GTP pyrophosphokinase
MDAEVIAAGLLQEALEAGYLRINAVERKLGNGVGRLLHDCARVKHMPSRMDTLDDDSANVVRQFCLAFHDVRAVVVVVSARLDVMRHVQTLPRYRQQILALETMQIYAPLAHVMGTGTMGLELEDLGFWVLFPDSYSYIESWLKRHWADGDKLVADSQQLFLASLEADPELQALIKLVTITGRCKSRYSTMKKLLKDGRQPEEVYDILGLRVVLTPKDGDSLLEEKERGVQACYRAMEIATSLWKELKGRLKDYIAAPKENGYESLHFAVCLGDNANWSPHMEIQIRTAAMHAMAEGGLASHSLYKGGLTDPEQAGYLKAIMLAAADVAASRFSDLAGNAVEVIDREDRIYSNSDHIFRHFDKNRDGVISMDELQQVIRDLGADSNGSHDLMRIVDSNLDGSVCAEEFQNFCRQVKIFENLAGVDKQFTTQLDQKLLTDSVDTTEGTVEETYATFLDGSSSSTYKDNINSSSSQYPSLQTSADLRPPSSLTNGPVFVEQPTTENIERMMMDDDLTLHKSVKKSVNSSAVSESLDSPVGDKLLVEEPEKLMWMERIKGSAKSSTSTIVTQSGSNVRNKLTNSSITGLAKPEKPAHFLAWAKPKTDDTFQHDDGDLVLLQSSGQSTTVCRNEEEKVETMLTLTETDSMESSIDSELTEIRRQIISGDRAAAHSSLTMVSAQSLIEPLLHIIVVVS